jgi:hypothetical protein
VWRFACGRRRVKTLSSVQRFVDAKLSPVDRTELRRSQSGPVKPNRVDSGVEIWNLCEVVCRNKPLISMHGAIDRSRYSQTIEVSSNFKPSSWISHKCPHGEHFQSSKPRHWILFSDRDDTNNIRLYSRLTFLFSWIKVDLQLLLSIYQLCLTSDYLYFLLLCTIY